MDRGGWQATVHGVTKSWTWLSFWSDLNPILEIFPWENRIQENKWTSSSQILSSHQFSFQFLHAGDTVASLGPTKAAASPEAPYSSCITGAAPAPWLSDQACFLYGSDTPRLNTQGSPSNCALLSPTASRPNWSRRPVLTSSKSGSRMPGQENSNSKALILMPALKPSWHLRND